MKLPAAYDRFQRLGAALQSPLLLVIRLYWGWQFFLTGRGKLLHLDRTADYFASLHIPVPKLNAFMAGSTECVCGLLLLVGLFARAASVPVTVTLLVAYITADREAFQSFFSDPDKFFAATPFLFLYAVILVLAFGPGRFSLDHLWDRRRAGAKAAGAA
jgi:putative oxidoreductase